MHKIEYKNGKCTDLLNIEVLPYGGANIVDYKTLRGFVQMLKRQNKVCKERGIECRFDITLPIKD